MAVKKTSTKVNALARIVSYMGVTKKVLYLGWNEHLLKAYFERVMTQFQN